MSCRIARISCARFDITASIEPSIERLLDSEVRGYLGLFVLESQHRRYFGTGRDLYTLGRELVTSGRSQRYFRLGAGVDHGQLGSQVGAVDLLAVILDVQLNSIRASHQLERHVAYELHDAAMLGLGPSVRLCHIEW